MAESYTLHDFPMIEPRRPRSPPAVPPAEALGRCEVGGEVGGDGAREVAEAAVRPDASLAVFSPTIASVERSMFEGTWTARSLPP